MTDVRTYITRIMDAVEFNYEGTQTMIDQRGNAIIILFKEGDCDAWKERVRGIIKEEKLDSKIELSFFNYGRHGLYCPVTTIKKAKRLSAYQHARRPKRSGVHGIRLHP